MATKHEEITHVLEQAGEEDIEIIRLTDEMVIHIKTAPKPASPEQEKGKWAKVAEELSREAPLTGIGEEFLRACFKTPASAGRARRTVARNRSVHGST